jgi:hypothetical protein
MKSRFRKLAVESLEGRSVFSATAFADFNHDGLQDKAAITGPNTITVSLAILGGGYSVSDILTTPKNQPFVDIVYTEDGDHDGDVDIYALTSKPSGSFQFEIRLVRTAGRDYQVRARLPGFLPKRDESGEAILC